MEGEAALAPGLPDRKGDALAPGKAVGGAVGGGDGGGGGGGLAGLVESAATVAVVGAALDAGVAAGDAALVETVLEHSLGGRHWNRRRERTKGDFLFLSLLFSWVCLEIFFGCSKRDFQI